MGRRYKGIKGKAWEVVRKYIIKRDGAICVTCGRRGENGYQMQAGHFQPVGFVGSNNKLSWDERNIYCQCARCNGPGQGRSDLMARHIEITHGKDVVEELQQRAHKVDPVKDWDSLIENYKQLTDGLST